MKLFLKFLLFSTLLFSININAQKEQKYNWVGTFSKVYNLKDSVKTVYCKFNKPKETWSKRERANVIISNGISVSSFVEVDKHNRLKAEITSIPGNNYFTQIDYSRADEYIYNDKDCAEKSKFKTALKWYYPVANYNLLMKLNQIEVSHKDEVLEEDGKIWSDYCANIYTYIYDKLGRIVEEKQYNVVRLGKETLHKKYKKEDLFTRKLFTYNDKDQVINQKIIAGLYGKKIGAYTDMGTESPFCEDLQLQYEYDSLGRITQVTMYGCGKIVDKEEYSYHPTQDYVETVKYYITGPGTISNPTTKYLKTFNEQGDMIKKEFILDDPEQELPVKEYYYSYEYDSHNNWIKCNIYMEGTQEGIPSLVAERKIEYYN
ncbi:hypothetical protein FVB9288_03014 [Flavobacterium sp. CECT 9288]|uniref:hypothetical protein n=1 Tax=Flavobacterium sp. CECT 9288 TaxID=2845819 RepID=UPI001E434007|nr:hypothetical protein [Flavobacterium sp. CECT 9288]CAH0337262.1 hypothetical protein FVB9288_03014 [Flavobacterium sp. CECT 9288]